GALYAGWGRRRLKRGVFRSLVELQAAINRFIAETNHEPKPFVWTADPDKIIAAIESRAPSVRLDPLEHDPEKWVPIFGQDHAPKLGRGRMARPRPIGARSDNRIDRAAGASSQTHALTIPSVRRYQAFILC